MNTLLLNPQTWDLTLNASGDIALATEPYSLAQDAASAIRLFYGEYYYDTTLGTNYFSTTLGKVPSIQLLKAQAVAAALTVPGVASAVCYISSVSNRQVQGQVQVTSSTGQVTSAGFTA